MNWAGRNIVFIAAFIFLASSQTYAEYNQWPGGSYGYGNPGYSPYGYGQGQFGPNGMPYGSNPYGPYGSSAYPSLVTPQQQMLFGLLAKAKAAVYKPHAQSNDLKPVKSVSLESFTASIAAGQAAMTKAMQPIPEIQLGDAFLAAFTREKKPWRDPLAGLSEQLDAMGKSMIEATKFPEITKPAVSQPDEATIKQVAQPSATVGQSRPAGSKWLLPVANNRSKSLSRGIASIQADGESAEPIPHREMHSPLGHAMHGDHDHSAVRVIPYQ